MSGSYWAIKLLDQCSIRGAEEGTLSSAEKKSPRISFPKRTMSAANFLTFSARPQRTVLRSMVDLIGSMADPLGSSSS